LVCHGVFFIVKIETNQSSMPRAASFMIPLKTAKGFSMSLAAGSMQLGLVLFGRAHLDTAPDPAGIAERRSPIRRVSGRFSIPAGSETGAPGAVSRCALFGLTGTPAASPAAAEEQPLLTPARQVHQLTPEEAAKAHPVRIRGVVASPVAVLPAAGEFLSCEKTS
jgi:hypothetical protein